MFKNVQNAKKQGDIGMAYAIAYYSRLGYTVCIPMTDSQDYDLIIDTGNSLLKVQVKTTDYVTDSGTYQVSLKTCGGNRSGQTIKTFDSNSSDLLFVLTGNGSCYSIPKSEITTKNTLNLGDKYQIFRVSL